MTYKKDSERIEDAIIPSILEALMLSHVAQIPQNKKHFEKHLQLLKSDIFLEANSIKLRKRLERIEKKVLKHFEQNKILIPKAYMIITFLADKLNELEAIQLNGNTRQVISEISHEIKKGYKDESIKQMDYEAEQEVPQVLTLLQQEGLF